MGNLNGLGANQPDLITASNSGILAEKITFEKREKSGRIKGQHHRLVYMKAFITQ